MAAIASACAHRRAPSKRSGGVYREVVVPKRIIFTQTVMTVTFAGLRACFQQDGRLKAPATVNNAVLNRAEPV